MRTFITTLTLAALLGGSLAPVAGAQGMLDAGSAERLRAAIARQQSLGGDRYRDPVTLDALVAPVALYPDALLDQVLAAATYPDQVRDAGQVLEDAPGLSRDELDDALSERDWDPSILILLSDFPSVIARMAADMTWTAQLGGAVIDQNEDVMAAVQRQRSRAYAAGNLVSGGPQVITRDSGRIFIRSAQPGTLYAPTYDPRAVYTIPNAPPPAPGGGTGLSPSPLVAGALAFGTALLIGELTKPDRHHRDDSDKRRRHDRERRDREEDWRNRRVIYPGPDLRPFQDREDERAAAREAERRHSNRAEEERQEARQARRREEARREARDDRRKAERREEARSERRKAERAEDARREQRREDHAKKARKEKREDDRGSTADGKDRKAERRPEGDRHKAERRGDDDRRSKHREARQSDRNRDRDRSESRGERQKSKKHKECREDSRECRRQ